jgi:hypothetical protein
LLVALAVSATACTSETGSGTTDATLGPDTPWLGAVTPAGLPAPVNSLTAIDCVNAALCWSVGSTVGFAGAPNGAAVIATTDGGVRWTSQVIPPTVGYLSAVSCSDARRCVAVGQSAQTTDVSGAAIATTDGGASWVPVPVPPGIVDVTAVTCAPSRRCLAIGSTGVGAVALLSTSAGTTWIQEGALPPGISDATSISCAGAGAQNCWVTAHTSPNPDTVAGAVAVTTDGGGGWATVTLPAGLGYLNGISCITGSPTGAGAEPTTVTSAAPAGPGPGSTAPGSAVPASAPATTAPAVAAPPPPGVPGVRCTLVGTTATLLNAVRSGRGVVLTTDNGGAAWTDQPVNASVASLRGVSCVAIGSCLAVGSSVATASSAGVALFTGPTTSPWRRAVAVSAPLPLTAVSCVSDAACVWVGESITAHLAGG